MNASLLLAIATLALVVGPLLERVARRQPRIAGLVDGMTVGGIVVVALLHLMPESAAHLGLWAGLLFLVGLFLPLVTERALVNRWQGWRITVGALILVLFVAHLLFEGAALASTASNERLAIATVLVVAGHNLPLGVLLWGQTRQRFGRAWSMVVLGAVAAITWFGPFMPISSLTFSAACSALLAGGLLHLVLQHDSGHHEHEGRALRNTWAAVGTVAAAWILIRYLGVEEEGSPEHAHGGAHLPGAFLHLFLRTAPALLLGVLAAGLIEAFLPEVATRWLSRGSSFGQAMRGVIVGTPMPVCSCGVLPIYRALLVRGVPATAALALLVAAPEIGVDSLLLSWTLLGWEATLARLSAALVLALAIGWFVGRMAETRTPKPPEHEHAKPARTGLANVAHGLFETWAHLGPWILLGLFATVFIETFMTPEATAWARGIAPWKQVIVLSLAGMPSYICASAATPLAALLLASGFAPGAVLAFLLTGPATNWSTFLALRKLHSTRIALAFALTALTVTFLLGIAVNSLLPAGGLLHEPGTADHEEGALAVLSACLLCALTLWILIREGPRGFLSQLSPGTEPHVH
ncbi:MAG TPA: permease [Planctomycetota bacterium]|nr:permease [Planctomycetota bacterium]